MGRPCRVVFAVVVCLAACSRSGSNSLPAEHGTSFGYVPGSTSKVCTLTGAPTADLARQTKNARRFGLVAADNGYSFSYRGNTWFVFGDSKPTTDFPEGSGQPNAAVRYPKLASGLDNDAIAYAKPTPPGTCPALEFVPRKAPPVGAFTNPSVVLNGQPVSLRTNEAPQSGIAVNDRMFVVFKTANRCDLPSPPPSLGCTGSPGGFGHPTESVLGELADQSTLQFTGLYALSAPSTPYGDDAKFVNVALHQAADDYIYFWGTAGGASTHNSPPYLARVPPAQIRTKSAIAYYAGSSPAGAPTWGTNESAAVALFNDDPNCMGELGVEYNSYLKSWMMLYNCRNDSASHPRGIWMRTASQPWGPWSAPQTIFRSATDGYCVVMSKPSCPAPYNGGLGGDYGPYFIAGWTTGTPATANVPASTTIYYTVDTFVPYGQVIECSTIVETPAGRPQAPPATHC